MIKSTKKKKKKRKKEKKDKKKNNNLPTFVWASILAPFPNNNFTILLVPFSCFEAIWREVQPFFFKKEKFC